VDVTGERIGMAEMGKATALHAVDLIQRSSPYAAAVKAEGEDCAHSEAATCDASLPRKNLPARTPGSRDPGRKAGAEAIRDLPARCGL
jgi:hypothetical protein